MSITKFFAAVGAVAILTTGSSAALQAHGNCKLVNAAANKVIYYGACTIRQSQNGENTIYEIKMGSGESFLFAGHGNEWMHGAEKASFKDLGGGAIFRWSNFTLSTVVE